MANRSTQEVRTASRASGASRTQRHHIPSADQSKPAIRSGTSRTAVHRRKTTGQAGPHSMATWKERHMESHRHKHRRRLIPLSNIGEVWMRCSARRYKEKEDKYFDLQQTYTFARWRLKRLDPLTSKAWNFFKSRAASAHPSATTTAILHFCASAYPSRSSSSTLSRSLTHLRQLLS